MSDLSFHAPNTNGRSRLRPDFALRVGAYALACVTGCDELAGPLDVLGAEQVVVETKETELHADVRPTFDPELTIVEEFDGCRMRLNKSASRTSLTVKDLDDPVLGGRIFPTRAAALAAIGSRPVIPSMEVVNGALKPFNDGLYASVELMAEHAEGTVLDKRGTFDAVLATMLERARAGDHDAALAAVDFAVAARLADEGIELPADVDSSARQVRERFDRDVFDATPIGFYTWTPELSTIFRRDRFLQNSLRLSRAGFRTMAAVSRALANDGELAQSYRAILDLYRGLTNPWSDFDPVALMPSVRDVVTSDLDAAEARFSAEHPQLRAAPACRAQFSWLPASESPERRLLATQQCMGVDVSNILDAFIAAIQSGAIDLTPGADSGWYDWQLYALETLLLPERGTESQHLVLSKKYRDKLVESFKSLLIQTRETHVKQLGNVAVAASYHAPPHEVDVYPLLPVEPFPTFYLRTARGYVFLRNLLDAALGSNALQRAHRLREDGSSVDDTLATELADKIELMYGLHLVAAASIGMRDELREDELAELDSERAQRAARDWLAGWRDDRDVLVDSRVAVPLVLDENAGVTRQLAVVGVRVIEISAAFPKGFEPEVEAEPQTDWSQPPCSLRSFVPFEPFMLVDQSLEFERAAQLPPLTRTQLRERLGDEDSLEAVRAALQAP